MPFIQVTPQEAVDAMIRMDVAKIKRKAITALQRTGEEAVKAARRSHRYKDQTGNLTSSIGYAVVFEGRLITKSGFDVVKDGKEGAEVGEALLDRLVSEIGNGTALILVAGMEYAGFVEDKGLDVLSSANLVAESTLPRLLEKHGLR